MQRQRRWRKATRERDQALAWLRLAFAILTILVIQLNPSRGARFLGLSIFIWPPSCYTALPLFT
jgi:hypothetical protein